MMGAGGSMLVVDESLAEPADGRRAGVLGVNGCGGSCGGSWDTWTGMVEGANRIARSLPRAS